MEFKVLESITVRSSAGTSQLPLTIAEHLAPFLTPNYGYFPPCPFHSCDTALFAIPPTCQTCTQLTRSLHLQFSIIRIVFSWIYASLLISFFSQVCSNTFQDSLYKLQSFLYVYSIFSFSITLLYIFPSSSNMLYVYVLLAFLSCTLH